MLGRIQNPTRPFPNLRTLQWCRKFVSVLLRPARLFINPSDITVFLTLARAIVQESEDRVECGNLRDDLYPHLGFIIT